MTVELTEHPDPQRIWDYMTDAANEPEWIGGLKTSELQGDPPLREGSRVERVAGFLGRRIGRGRKHKPHAP